MDNLFNEAPITAEEAVVAAPVKSESDNKKAKIQMMKDAMRERIASDPSYVSRLRKYSNFVKVENSLGFGESGNIIVDPTKKDRTLVATSAIVGYRVSNVGTEPIKYVTESWAKDETGKYVATKTEKVLAPGGYADLTRQYMTMFCAQPEISFQLQNGKVIKGSGCKGDKGVKSELESYYFAFSKDENGNRPQINDDVVKLNVGEKVDGKWVVKQEFEETFGYLNNARETTKSGKKAKGSEFNAQDIAANYVFKMIQDSGL